MSQTERPNNCCGSGGCGGLDRREFLKSAGLGLVTLSSLGAGAQVMAGPFFRSADGLDHFVPPDKRLIPEWLKSLYLRGAPRVCRETELNLIGMPVGGVGAGQVYLCGDGTLACWKIFNQQYFSTTGDYNYIHRIPERPISQGCALVIEEGDTTRAWQLNRQDFPGVEFVGEYPLGRVKYAAPGVPVSVELTAFSPFVPLNARDSALPVTVLEYRIENTSDRPVRVGMLGWLENAVCFHSTREYGLVVRRRTRLSGDLRQALLVHTAEPLEPATAAREDIVLADFEGGAYGDWKVEGEAFGEKPATGTLPDQNPVTGFAGQGLVNSYVGGDSSQGRLLSPTFAISRKYICFLIGGGQHAGQTCVNLLVEGKTVRTATGSNSERLTWNTWDVQELDGQAAQIEIVDRGSGPWGHVNVDQIMQSDQQRFGTAGALEQLEDFGSMALGLGERGLSPDATEALLGRLPGFREELRGAADVSYPSSQEERTPTVAAHVTDLSPGLLRKIVFVVAWHFPNRAEGNNYANWFADAADTVRYVFDEYERIAADTQTWHDTYYDSTLPRWLLDRLHCPVCNLATGTCMWWKNGRFWAWEGVGCCEGTCTHVWNYAQAAARLLPELERSVREMQDLDAAFHDNGLVGFRGARNKAYAADGQAGTVLKCYREHQMSADGSFLQRNWPKIKQVLEFCIKQDGDDDGLIENSQHNTFDINFEGPNTFVGALYLAALRAGEEMAREAGDAEFVERARRVFESGRRLTSERLFNGEYFIQAVDLKKYPKFQYGDGCLSDQLFGQGWAHQLGLGYIYPPEQVKQALQSIWKYNWAPDIGPQNAAHPPQRWFVQPGEAGLFTCTWPHGQHLKDAVLYRDEVWTGTEYQVAGDMIWEGLVEQGLVLVRAIHDRYDPARHNPYNEVECGDHYARAMASWGVYLALCGFEYHGPKGHLGFAPRLSPENFRAAFTAAEGWGTFAQQRTETTLFAQIEVRWGGLRLSSLALVVPESVDERRFAAQIGDHYFAVTPQRQGQRLVLQFTEPIWVAGGQKLEVRLGQS